MLRTGVIAGALALSAVWASAACSPVVRVFGGSGGSGGSGTGGSGGGPITGCKPGTTKECYSGPAATKDVGNCKHGTATCDVEGSPGACEGETLPVASGAVDCTKHEDQDCDGVPDRCPLDYIWGHAYGVAGGAYIPPSVGVDGAGNITLAGSFSGQLDFGSGLLTSAANDEDVFVARLDPTGATLWSKKVGDATGYQECNAATSDAAGNMYLAGSYEGTMDNLGIVLPTSAGANDAYVAKLDSSGNAVWARAGGDASSQSVQALALTPTGDVIAAGTFYGTWSFSGGGTTFANTLGLGNNIFVQRFDSVGNAVWGVSLGSVAGAGNNDQQLFNIAVDVNGDVIVAGSFQGTVQFPDGTLKTSAGSYDVMLMKLHGTDGALIWAHTYGGPGDDEAQGVSADSKGDIVVSGRFEQTLSMDAYTVAPVAPNTIGLFLAKLASSGTVSWLQGYGAATQSAAMIVQVAENDGLLLTGAFDGTVDFGGGPLIAPAMPPQLPVLGFVAKLDATGKHLASRAIVPSVPMGSTDTPLAYLFHAVAAPKTNEVVVSGLTFGQVDLGGGPIGLDKVGSPLIAKYAP
jgi:hypothetical protein